MRTNEFGERLRRLRLESNLSIREVADLLKIPPSSYADIESRGYGRHAIAILPQLSKIYGISLSSLLGRAPLTQTIADDCRAIQELAGNIVRKLTE